MNEKKFFNKINSIITLFPRILMVYKHTKEDNLFNEINNLMTEQENKIYQQIITYIKDNHYMPSIRYLQNLNGYHSHNTVYKYLKCLEKKGYLTRQNEQKKLMPTANISFSNQDVTSILVINTQETIIINIDNKKQYLAYKITNNYFRHYCIKKNDYLIIEKTNQIANNNLGLFVINQEYRIMQYTYQDGFYMLKDNVQETLYKINLIGKVVGIYRQKI